MNTYENKLNTTFEIPTVEHLDIIAAAIVRTAEVAEGAEVFVSKEKRLMHVLVDRLEGFVGDWTWPLVSRGLYATIQLTNEGKAVKSVLYQQIVRKGMPETTIQHEYELESAEDQVIVFGQGVKVIPRVPEEISPVNQSLVGYVQASEGAVRIEQDFGENQEMYVQDCDFLFDNITSFWK